MAYGTLDIILLVLSLVASALIGIYHGVKGLKANSAEYMLGSRTLRPLPLALSLTVGTVSAITIMGNAGEMYAHGTQLWLMDFGVAIGIIVVAKVFIPIFYPLKAVSLYQYIERRFNSTWLRKATVLVTMVAAYVFIGFLLFPPSAFLSQLTGLPPVANIFVMGLSCSIYSAFGGVKAVVYADVLQSFIMIAGVIAIILQGIANVEGLGRAWDIAYHRGRIEFFNFDLNPFQHHSFWLVIVYGFFFSLSTYGVNQSQTQRAFSTGSVVQAQWVMYYSAIGLLILKSTINLSGVVIFATYVDCDPLARYNFTELYIVPYYVSENLSRIPGLTGLFVASIYAAVLSSVSTQVNSMTALLWEDFCKGHQYFSEWTEIKITTFQKILVFLSGVAGIVMSLVVSRLGSFLRALLKITGAVSGPMVGLFILAVYLPWVRVKGAATGFITSILVSLMIIIGQLVTQTNPKFLPSSVAGCHRINGTDPSDQGNVTSAEAELAILDTPEDQGHGFFGLSYCLNYCWGSLTCVLVAVTVTLFTGSNTPHTVEEGLINPSSWKLFVKLSPAKTWRQMLSLCLRKECHSPEASGHHSPKSRDSATQEEAEALSSQMSLDAKTVV